jgi:hypothetical protein
LPNTHIVTQGLLFLTPMEMWIAPWEELEIDHQGQQQKGWVQFTHVHWHWSNLVELIRINDKIMHCIRDKFFKCWLSFPVSCIHHYEGAQFIGGTFQWILHSFDIKDVQSTSINLQSNFIHWLCTTQWAWYFKHCCIAIHCKI